MTRQDLYVVLGVLLFLCFAAYGVVAGSGLVITVVGVVVVVGCFAGAAWWYWKNWINPPPKQEQD